MYLLTTFRPCFQPVLFSIFADFLIFLLQIWHNTARNIHNTQPHTRTHTCTPATDRDLESGLSKSHTRKHPRNMPEKGKVRRISGECSLRYRRANRSSAARWRKTNGTIWYLVPSEVSFIVRKKRMIKGIGNALFSTYAQTSNGQNLVVTLGQPLEQVITLRGPFLVSRKLATKDAPNIGLRCCSTCSKTLVLSIKITRSYPAKHCFTE